MELKDNVNINPRDKTLFALINHGQKNPIKVLI